MSSLIKGDIVKLKSGGPDMTVQEITQQYKNGVALDGYHIRCFWFINNQLEDATFDQESLDKVIPASGSRKIHI